MAERRGRGLRLFGHPVHPMLSDFPLALLGIAPAVDAAAIWLDGRAWLASWWSIAAGCALAVPTAVAGFIDFAALAKDDPAEKHATPHMMLMLGAVCSFGGSLAVRGAPGPVAGGARWLAFALSLFGLALALLGGWFGGHLVFHHGVGVHGGGDHRPL